jgi:hypothetical protein
MDDIPLRDYFESRLQAHAEVHAQEALARAEAAKRIDARLEQLNELRAEVLTDRNRLVNRELFDARREAVDTRIDTLHDQITEWRGRDKGLSLFASVVVGGVAFVATVLAIYFAIAG